MKNIDKINQNLLDLHKSANLPPYNPNLLADVLIDEFKKSGSEIPESTRQIIIGVAASLKRHHFDNLISDIEALKAINTMKKIPPPSTNKGN